MFMFRMLRLQVATFLFANVFVFGAMVSVRAPARPLVLNSWMAARRMAFLVCSARRFGFWSLADID